MNRQRSLATLILIPAVVSFAITLLVLTLWDRQRAPEQRVIMLPTYSSTALIPPRETFPPSAGGSAAGESGAAEGGAGPAPDQPAQEPASAACENPVHTVASGEVLGAIADRYGVTIDDLVTINTLVDPAFNADFLSVGQQLVIPVCGIPTPTPTSAPTETPVPTRSIPAPIPTSTAPPPGAVSVVIARVLNPGDITTEAVELVNQGSPVDLAGWSLSDGERAEFLFPSFRLFAGGGVTVYTGVGENTPIDLYWGLDEAVWEIGKTVQLIDADGELQDEYEITE